MSSEQKKSLIKERGLKTVVSETIDKMKELYLADSTPWVIGYSGGKDSTAVAQLVWQMLQEIPVEQRTKEVHIISTDTLVENPVVSKWVEESHTKIETQAQEERLPVYPHLLKPDIKDTFWVNIVGKGYPAPRHKFRWCTDRLKIRPSNKFIRSVIAEHGEAIMVMGMRKGESSTRAAVMDRYDKKRVRDDLKPSASLANSLIYTPIDDWTNDDVWLYLMQVKNPWGHSNKDLMGMYRGASEDNECPLVIDTSTPSCGNSRFGCWVCTLVEQDKSMGAMITNDAEKEWMRPLLDFRNDIDFRGDEQRQKDRERRDFRRMNGSITMNDSGAVPGPYTQKARADFLRRILKLQKHANTNAPDDMSGTNVITMDELEEIRRIWVEEKHEIEDLLPKIYEEIMEAPYPGGDYTGQRAIPNEVTQVLNDEVDGDELQYEMLRNLISVEHKYAGMARRNGVLTDLEDVLKRAGYSSKEEAKRLASERQEIKGAIENEDTDELMKRFESLEEASPNEDS